MTYYPPGYSTPSYQPQPPPIPPRKGIPWWGWLLIITGGATVISCAGCLGFFIYFASVTPDTKVYTGREVPSEYIQTAEGLGVLQPNEQVRYFYSDALTDIREGFYVITDTRVVTFVEGASEELTSIPFSNIESASMIASDSILEDSSITLQLKDGDWHSFPVSSELGRDQQVLEYIQSQIDPIDP